MWPLRLNAIVGSVVVTIGFWLTWGTITTPTLVMIALGVAAFLMWRAHSLPEVWAWATLLLGSECLAWPILTMVRIRMETTEPSDQQMGDILFSVIFGIFTAIFWLTFSYGTFRKLYPPIPSADPPVTTSSATGRSNKKKKKKKGSR